MNTNFSDYKSFFTGETARAYKEDSKMVNLLKNRRVMGRHEGFAFNNRSFFIYSPTINTLEGLVNYARIWKVSYIVANRNDLDNSLGFLYLNPKDYPGLKLDLSLDSETYLYRVVY